MFWLTKVGTTQAERVFNMHLHTMAGAAAPWRFAVWPIGAEVRARAQARRISLIPMWGTCVPLASRRRTWHRWRERDARRFSWQRLNADGAPVKQTADGSEKAEP